MLNPILQRLQRNPQMQNLMQLKNILCAQNPDSVFNNMMNTNPQFKQFINDNRGKSIEQVAQEHGIDIDSIKKMI